MGENVYDWSTTAGNNNTADSSINWSENQVPGSVNDSARSMMAALAKFLGDINGTKSTAGTSTALTLAAPNISYTALNNGTMVGFKASVTNGSPVTFNLNSLGGKKIKVFSAGAEADAPAGSIVQNGHYIVQYDTAADSAAGAWILLNPTDQYPGFLGEVKEYAGATAPSANWLIADGAAISRTTYASLFSLIGTTYGAGNGSTTFNIPDRTGRVGVGKEAAATRVTSAGSGIDGATLGATGGSQSLAAHTHGLTAASAASGGAVAASVNDPTHSHITADVFDTANIAAGSDFTGWIQSTANMATSAAATGITVTGGAHTHSLSGSTDSTGAGGSANMPPAIVMNYIIRVL